METMRRRDFLKVVGAGAMASVMGCGITKDVFIAKRKPNIVYILADDLGYAEVGCYGQKKIKTPHIDRLATQGMKFTQHYSGNPVCAPSRCSLMTGLHTGHTQVRGNRQIGGKEGWKLGSRASGQWPMEEGTVTIAGILQDAGYTTGAFGKWGIGMVGTTGDPQKQGFDHFYGYICQRQAHTHYPDHLWRDGKVEEIPENKGGKEVVYSHDLLAKEALNFIKANKDKPFFCYVPFAIPHVSIQVPEDSMAEYKGKWPETRFESQGMYFPQDNPRAGYAAMITRMDSDVGRIMDLLKELGLEDDTLVIFTSDNGPTFNGGSDSEFFESAGPLRGLKGSVYEGGIRVPCIAKWPGKIAAGSESDHVSAFWDFMPTCCEMIGEKVPAEIDGVSMLPELLGKKSKQKQHEHLYWELGRRQAIRMGDIKAVRYDRGKIEIYDLKVDIGETKDLADERPQLLAKMEKLFVTARTESDIFPLPKPKKAKS